MLCYTGDNMIRRLKKGVDKSPLLLSCIGDFQKEDKID